MRFNAALIDEAVTTLEKLAFIFASANIDRDTFAGSEAAVVEARFQGPFSGRLIMEYGLNGLTELTGNMLGIDEEDVTDALRIDALKEAINVVCGNLLPAIGGRTAVFNIDTPIESRRPAEEAVGHAQGVARLDVDGSHCDLYLFIESGDPDDDAVSAG